MGAWNHIKSYLRVPKTVTREEAYKSGQKLQTYILSSFVTLLLQNLIVFLEVIITPRLVHLHFHVQIRILLTILILFLSMMKRSFLSKIKVKKISQWIPVMKIVQLFLVKMMIVTNIVDHLLNHLNGVINHNNKTCTRNFSFTPYATFKFIKFIKCAISCNFRNF